LQRITKVADVACAVISLIWPPKLSMATQPS
jgi:hypothetical protein